MEIGDAMPSPTRFVLVAMSTGEANHVLGCLLELDKTAAGVPERAYSLIDDAMEEGLLLTLDQLDKTRDFASKLVGEGPDTNDEQED